MEMTAPLPTASAPIRLFVTCVPLSVLLRKFSVLITEGALSYTPLNTFVMAQLLTKQFTFGVPLPRMNTPFVAELPEMLPLILQSETPELCAAPRMVTAPLEEDVVPLSVSVRFRVPAVWPTAVPSMVTYCVPLSTIPPLTPSYARLMEQAVLPVAGWMVIVFTELDAGLALI